MAGDDTRPEWHRETVGQRTAAPPTSIPSNVDVDGAVRTLTTVAADYLGAVGQEHEQTIRSVAAQRSSTASKADRERAIVRNRADHLALQTVDSIRSACDRLVPGTLGKAWDEPVWGQVNPGILDVAHHIRCGQLVLDQSAGRVSNESIAVPMVAPLLNSGNIVVRSVAGNAAALGVVQQAVLRALAGTGPGQLTLHSIDPALRGLLSPFSGLRAGGEELLPPSRYSAEQIEELLGKLTADVQRVTDLFRGRPITLADLRSETGQPIEHFQLVVVSDFPDAFDQRSLRMLGTLIESGPRCGISFVIHEASDGQRPDGVTIESLYRNATVINVDTSTVVEPARNSITWGPEPAVDLRTLETVVSRLGEQARHAAAPSVGFGQLHPEDLSWGRSSAAGLTAVIGQAGHHPVEITLGDSREQRHNVLVSGAVGQGKSNLLLVLIHSLAVHYGPDELEMYLLDLKDGMTLAPLSASDSFLPHAKVLGLQSDREFAAAVLQHLVGEFERRAPIMREYGDNIERYREARPEAKLPRILLCIDEFQTLFEEDDELAQQAMNSLERLAKKGRAYGIHVVLGSQTLSGITTLLSKQDGIFAQFPIRLALKNTPNESRVVLDSQNVEASRLRYRGEAVVNLDFGSVDANQRAVIAAADLGELRDLRARLVRAADRPPPAIYDGTVPAQLVDHADWLVRRRHDRSPSDFTALIGRHIDVDGEPVGVPLGAENGRHLAIIGAGQPGRDGDSGGNGDLAVGVLQSAALSLALQDRSLTAQFVVLDLMTSEQRRRAELDRFLSTMGAFGAAVEVVGADAVPERLRQLGSMVADRALDDGPVFVLAFGMDRCADMDTANTEFVTPAEGLRSILRSGGARHVHLLAHWQTVRSYKDHMGFDLLGSIGAQLVLRVQAGDAADLMGPLIKWQPRNNRGLFLDAAYSEGTETVIPFAPPTGSALERLQLTTWDR